MNLWPLLPIIVPLASIPACAAIKERDAGRLTRRMVYTAALGMTAVSIALTALPGTSPLTLGSTEGYLAAPTAPLWSPLSYWAASVLMLVLLLGQLTQLQHPLTAAHSMHYLVTLSATMATVSASNAISLVLAWSIPHLLVMYLRSAHGEATVRSSRWDTWSSFVSLALVVIGAVALSAEQNGTLYLVAIGPGLAFTALAAGAGLRLVSWLLVGGPGRWWQLHAMSMISGFYLWLRLGIVLQAEQPLLGNPGMAVPIALALGLIIGPREGQSRVVPVGFGYWLALALLAPALAPGTGYAVSLLVATQLMLCLSLLRGSSDMPSESRLRTVPGMIAWGALSGVILTSGFVVHWAFGQICLRAGGPGLLAIASIGYLLVAVPLGRRLTWSPGTALQGRLLAARDSGAIVGLVVAGLLVLLGIWPGIIERVWPDIRLGLDALEYSRLWGNSAADRLALFIAVLVVPMGAGLAARRVPRVQDILYGWIVRAEQGLRGEWLYLLAQRVLARATRDLRHGLAAIEESLALRWCLLWGLALVYYLLQR